MEKRTPATSCLLYKTYLKHNIKWLKTNIFKKICQAKQKPQENWQ